MKTISIGFEDSLLKEINKKSKLLKMTRAELIRNAIMEFIFHFDEVLDAKMLAQAVEKDEEKRPLEKIAQELTQTKKEQVQWKTELLLKSKSVLTPAQQEKLSTLPK